MKILIISLLTLLFAFPAFALPDDNPSEGRAHRRSYRHSRNKQWRKKWRRARLSYSKRRAAARKSIARKRTASASRLASRKKPVLRSRLIAAVPKNVTAKPTPVKPVPVKTNAVKPTPTPLPRIPDTWRGYVKRSVAQTYDGRNAPVEMYANLGTLINTLPDDGEIRVRYGIYNGERTYGPMERMDVERRAVRVPCWIYAVKFDSTGDQNERDIQILVGSSNDTSRARYLIAEIPAPFASGLNEDMFEHVRQQLHDLLPDFALTSSFRRITPQQVILEGSLFFDGVRTLGSANDPSGNMPSPGTVWEIHPVTSIVAARTVE